MSKILKRIAWVIGLVLLVAVFILNVAYTGRISDGEKVTINENTILNLLASVFISITIYNTCKLLNMKMTTKKEENKSLEITKIW